MRWIDPLNTPILNHPLDQPSAFTASNLIDNVRRARRVPEAAVPPLCVLEFDGDLTGWLIREGIAKPFPAWPCFHAAMFAIECEGVRCSIIPRTIGGPYAVLIAEQLAAAGTELIVGLHPLAASLAIFPSLSCRRHQRGSRRRNVPSLFATQPRCCLRRSSCAAVRA